MENLDLSSYKKALCETFDGIKDIECIKLIDKYCIIRDQDDIHYIMLTKEQIEKIKSEFNDNLYNKYKDKILFKYIDWDQFKQDSWRLSDQCIFLSQCYSYDDIVFDIIDPPISNIFNIPFDESTSN